MARTSGEEQADDKERQARKAGEDIGQPGHDTLEEHPPHEQVSRLGTGAGEADAELERRQHSDFEGQARPRQRFSTGKLLTAIVVGLVVVIGGIWGIFFSS